MFYQGLKKYFFCDLITLAILDKEVNKVARARCFPNSPGWYQCGNCKKIFFLDEAILGADGAVVCPYCCMPQENLSYDNESAKIVKSIDEFLAQLFSNSGLE